MWPAVNAEEIDELVTRLADEFRQDLIDTLRRTLGETDPRCFHGAIFRGSATAVRCILFTGHSGDHLYR